jgi:hypothetical protein
MPHSLLNVGDHLPGTGLVPTAIEALGRNPELDNEITRKVLRLDLAPLLPPKPDQRLLVTAHDDPRVGAAYKVSTCLIPHESTSSSYEYYILI